MKINRYGEVILNEKEIITGLYSGKITSLKNIKTDSNKVVTQFNKWIETNADNIDSMSPYVEPTLTLTEYDNLHRSTWFIDDEHKNLDIKEWLLRQCKTNVETERVNEEIELFIQYGMLDVLVCLKYLVDFMRKNDIVWGLGRGSSVASYCLYLIGVHKVDSIKFNLDIKEFLKETKNDKEDL